MQVIVEIEIEARHQLLNLLHGRSRSAEDALLRSIHCCEEIDVVFKQYQAPPPLAELRSRGKTGYWWLFIDGIWITFTREDRTVGMRPFRKVVRVFTVVGAAAQPTDS